MGTSAAAAGGERPSLDLSREQVRAARGLLGLTQSELATLVGVRRRVLIDFENGASLPHRRTLLALRDVLEHAGLSFLSRSDGGLAVAISRAGLERLREAATRG